MLNRGVSPVVQGFDEYRVRLEEDAGKRKAKR